MRRDEVDVVRAEVMGSLMWKHQRWHKVVRAHMLGFNQYSVVEIQ